MSDRLYIRAEEVAELLDLPGPSAFLQRRRDLERVHGFPAPAPWSLRPLRWRRDAVTAWRDDRAALPGITADTPDRARAAALRSRARSA